MRRLVVLLAAVLAACDSGSAGSAGPDAPVLQEVTFPGATLAVRSQLWAPVFSGLRAGGLDLYWLEAPDACADPEGLVQHAGVPWLSAHVASPALGVDCPVNDWSQEGCWARLSLDLLDDHGRIFASIPSSGVLRISSAEDGRLVGMVRASFPAGFFQEVGCRVSGTGRDVSGTCSCDGPDGPWTCNIAGADDEMCCDDAFPVIELVLPFEADGCAAATWCQDRPCPPLELGACEPSTGAPPSCSVACAGYEAVCRSCAGCEGGDELCLEAAGCNGNACRAACHGPLVEDPAFATALRCFSRSDTCDRWEACMETCAAE